MNKKTCDTFVSKHEKINEVWFGHAFVNTVCCLL